ncbi:hypothetical protein F0562_022355 [Nyssa sinensis]|uniref:MD-2-related lipid-recognition domain-containing protein n=1 Tax=Nyssa sinensis TaxID=561372 RepID=A0A5J5BRN0_9ASTE|nr:hypothetical protein F0562_022355 [Nyssa sinensis]
MDVVAPLQFKLTVLFLLVACSHVPSIQSKDVKYCDKKVNYAVKVDGVDISPDPVVTGKPATFSISASTGKAISGGKLALDVSYFGIRVHTETHDLCKETSCPISVGKFVISHTQTLPGFTPPGSYTLKMKMEDENKHQLTCIRFGFNIGFGSFVSSI